MNNNEKNTQKKFFDAEVQGRTIFYNYLKSRGHEIIDVAGLTQPWDICVRNEDEQTTNYYELKYRWKYSSTDDIIQKDGIILEKIKYDGLKNYKAQRTIIDANTSSFYYCTLFNDGVGYVCHLNLNDDDNYNWEKKKMRYSQCANNGDKIVEKIITYIPLSQCKKFYYNADNKQNTYNYIITK